MHPFGLHEAREERVHRQPLHVTRVDAREQRFGQDVDRLTAEPPAEERGDGLVGAARRPRPRDEVQPHPQPAGPRDVIAAGKCGEARRDAERRAGGQGAEPAAAQDVGPPGRQRRHQAIGQAQFAAQLDGGRLLDEQ